MKKQFILLTAALFMGVVAKAQVGIGTENPSATLDIVSEAGSAKSVEVNNSTGTETVTVLDNGNVGIGITTPSAKLEVVSTDPLLGQVLQVTHPLKTDTSEPAIRISGASGAPAIGQNTFIGFNPNNSQGAYPVLVGAAYFNSIVGEGSADFFIATSQGGVALPKLVVQNGGNVGIGTTNPAKKLEIDAGSDYLRVTNLASVPSATPANSLVIDPVTGDIGQRSSSDVSAVKVIGYVGSVVNNVQTYIDDPAPGGISIERFDNLNEFSGHTFTASATGLYQVHFVTNFPSSDVGMDDGDGYFGQSNILVNGVSIGEPGGAIRVPLKDVSSPPASQDRIDHDYPNLVKLNAGDTLDFSVHIFGSTAGSGTGKQIGYSIQIVRID